MENKNPNNNRRLGRYGSPDVTAQSSQTTLELEQFRTYLALLARSLNGVNANEASDLVQKTLLTACIERDQFRGTTPRELAAWLKQILRHQAIDAYRRRRRLKRDVGREVSLDQTVDGSLDRAESWLAAVDSTPSHRASREEEVLRLADALAKLPDAQREAIVLHHLQGMKLAVIARQLGRSEAAVVGLLQRGLRQLRQKLGDGSSP